MEKPPPPICFTILKPVMSLVRYTMSYCGNRLTRDGGHAQLLWLGHGVQDVTGGRRQGVAGIGARSPR